MDSVKFLCCLFCLLALPAFAQDEIIYGSWSGSASYVNTYASIFGEIPDPEKNTSSMPLKGTRSVTLTISEGKCRIAFDLELACIYSPDEKVILIPEWRNSDSVYDSGLMVMMITDSSLELKNEYTRHSEEAGLYKFEMKGTEIYTLTKTN